MPDAPPPPTPLEVLTLAAISEQARYGYAIAGEIEALSGGRLTVRPGNLYRVLDRLQARGWVEPVEAPDGPPTDERRQYYRATTLGRALAADQLAMYAGVLRATPGLLDATGP